MFVCSRCAKSKCQSACLAETTPDNRSSSSSSSNNEAQPTTVCSSNMYRFHSSNVQRAGNLLQLHLVVCRARFTVRLHYHFPLTLGNNCILMVKYYCTTYCTLYHYPWPKSEAVLTLPPTVVTDASRGEAGARRLCRQNMHIKSAAVEIIIKKCIINTNAIPNAPRYSGQGLQSLQKSLIYRKYTRVV